MKAIKLFGRSKNCDEFGNPYAACAAICEDDEGQLTCVYYPATWGGKSSVRGFMFNKLDKLNIEYSRDVEYEYKRVKTMSALEHPERWRDVTKYHITNFIEQFA